MIYKSNVISKPPAKGKSDNALPTLVDRYYSPAVQ